VESDQTWRKRAVLGFLCGAAAMILAVAFWHSAGFAVSSGSASYPVTNWLVAPLGLAFLTVYAGLAFGAGWLCRQPLSIAAGFISPFPVAVMIEVSRHPTSHNLLPFEVVLYWLPLFLLALLLSFAGQRVRRRVAPARPVHPNAGERRQPPLTR
jgi:hypothetical protein